MRIRALLALSVSAIAMLCGARAFAHPPLTDGREGMTCGSHFAAVRAGWMRRGGDWTDAAGKPYGDDAYAVAALRRSSPKEPVEFDITSLAREWAAGKQAAGAVFLRVLPGHRGGTISFASRENPDSSTRPALIIEWSDGASSRLEPSADTSINCTTIRSLGAGRTISVGGNDAAIVIFPFGTQAKRDIRRARLILSIEKQWGSGTNIGVFRLTPPWALEAGPRTGLAASYQGDRNIESNPAVFFATGFDERNWRSGWSTYGRSSIAEVVSAGEGNGFKPLQDSALRVSLIPAQNLGLDLRYDFAKIHGSEPEQAYFRYYLRFGDDWNPTREGGKLPGFAGTYNRGGWGMRRSDGTNGWSARGAFFANRSETPEMKDFAGIGSYVYHPDIKGAESTVWGWGLGPTGRLRKNQWYSIEQYVKMNDIGQANGVLRAWIDGYLVFERMDIRFRDVTDLKIENAWFNVYHGGVDKPPHNMSLYIDNVVIAREYIGPMAGGK